MSEWERGKKGAIPHATVRLWVDGVEQKRREHIKIPPVSVFELSVGLLLMFSCPVPKVPKKQVPKTPKKPAPKKSKK